MPEIEADFRELIAILRQGRDGVREELEICQAQDPNHDALLRLLTAVRSFADQAQSLLVIMMDRRTDEASWVEVSDLATWFRAIEDLMEKVLALNRM